MSLVVEEPPDQVHPVSTLHVELHPSLFAVFPSSQDVVKVLNRLLSPHISEHVSLVVELPPVQVHPVSTFHVELHPSLFAVFPSSHLVDNVLNRLLSPQISDQVSLVVEDPPVHVHPPSYLSPLYPFSVLQSELHPSFGVVFLSSHCSDPTTNLSPQIAVQVEKCLVIQVLYPNKSEDDIYFKIN